MIPDALKRIAVFVTLLLVITAVGLLLAAPSPAQSIEDCLDCHEDEDLTKNEGDRVVSLYLDLDAYEASIHGVEGLECIDCHMDVEDFDGEHAEELEPVDCTMCHDDVGEIYAESLHGLAVARGESLAPKCGTCHGYHDIMPPEDPTSAVNRFNIPIMCGRCHKEGSPVSDFSSVDQDSVLEHYRMSIHGEGLYRRGLTGTAVCSDCHTAHDVRPHEDPRSTIHRDNVADMCMQCHGRIEDVHQKVIHGELWEKQPHMVPACIECHEPHEIRRVYYDEGMSDEECQRCHADHNSSRPTAARWRSATPSSGARPTRRSAASSATRAPR